MSSCESQIPTPESRIPNPDLLIPRDSGLGIRDWLRHAVTLPLRPFHDPLIARIPNVELRIPNPNSGIPNPESRFANSPGFGIGDSGLVASRCHAAFASFS